MNAPINRATEWEKGRTILKIGGLLIRHGYRDDPTWKIIDYYWRGRLFMTSARWYVVIEGVRQLVFILKYGSAKCQLIVDGARMWRDG